MDVEESQLSRKDITNKWLDLIYDHLVKLKNYEVQMREGCESLIQYINIPESQTRQLADVQLKCMDMMISEFEMTLGDVKEIVEEEELKKIRDKLDTCKAIRSKGLKIFSKKEKKKDLKDSKDSKDSKEQYEPVFKIVSHHIKKVKVLVLNDPFHILSKELSKLRVELVSMLKSILWLQGKEEKSGAED